MSRNLPINQVCSSTFINVMDVKENRTDEELELEMEMENRSDQQQQQQQQQTIEEEDDESLELSLSIRPTVKKKKTKMGTPVMFPTPPPPNVLFSSDASSSSSSSSQPNPPQNSHDHHDLFAAAAAAAAAFHVNQLNYTVLNTGNHQDGPIMHLGPLFEPQSLEPPPPPPPLHFPIRPRASYYAPAPAPAPALMNHDQQPAQDQPQPHVPPVVQRAAPRNRRIRSPGPNQDNVVFPPPFPWATDRFAKILSYEELLARGIYEITGDAQCKKCEHKVMIRYDLKTKFDKVGTFVFQNKHVLHDRAAKHWTVQTVPECPSCPNCDQPNSLKPVIPDDQKMINWLFLLLGEMIGCCTLDDLRFYCKHTGHHRTGAKDRLVYLTYLGLCHQLDPSGPFEYHPPRD